MTERPELPEESEISSGGLPLSPQPLSVEDRRDLIRSFLPIAGIELLLAAIMILIYVFMKRCTPSVLYGAILGTVVALGNFVFMAVSLIKAEHAETVAKGQLQAQGKYVLRMIVLLVLLIFALKSGYFAPLSTLLPLCFMRIAIYCSQIFYKFSQKKRNKEANS